MCWISSNITESSHQVQAVLDAGILPPLLKLLESQDSACREDATWVLYNISSNHDMRQISYLAEQNGIRALCNLLNCSKELDVLWKGCGTVAAVALKGLRNILVAGQQDANSDPNRYNLMAAHVAEAHGVERIEALTNHASGDVRQRARLLLERFFGAEPVPSSSEYSNVPDDYTNAANAAAAAAASAAAAAVVSPGSNLSHVSGAHYADPEVAAAAAAAIADPAGFAAAAAAAAAATTTTSTCSCPHPHPTMYSDHSPHLLPPLQPSGQLTGPADDHAEHDTAHAAAAAAAAHYHATAVVAAAAAATGFHSHAYGNSAGDPSLAHSVNGPLSSPANVSSRVLPATAEANGPATAVSAAGSSTESDPEDDDSDSDLLPPPPAPCSCVLCSDATPLADRRPRKGSGDGSTGSIVGGGGKASAGTGNHGDGSFSPGSGSTHGGEKKVPSNDVDGRGEKDTASSGSRVDGKDSATGERTRTLCDFCSGGGRLGDGKAGMAAKLGRAVRLGHSHCVAILLSRMTWSQRLAATEAPALLHPGGGPPDGGVSSSLPAVVLAAHLGKPECLALLLRRCRPDLDVTHGKKRLTPLAWAAHKGYYKCCELLLQHGAKAGAKCGECLTALHLCASGGGQLAICELLLKHGAPVDAKSNKGQTPLCLATQKGYSRLVRLLLEHNADCNSEDEGRFTPLHIAASNGFASSADELIRHGAKIDCKTRNGVTPLHYAVQGGHASVVSLLVSAGAKVNCTRKPLLIIAADDGNRQVVQILLDALAAIDCTANIKATLDKDTEIHDKLTPLHLSASKGHKDVVALLLRRGANVDARTEKGGWTALDFAVLNGHAACATILLENLALVSDTVKKTGQSGATLVQHAARNGHKTVVRLLVKRLQEQKTSGPGSAGSKDGGSAVTSSGSASFASGAMATAAPSPAPPSPLSLSGTGSHLQDTETISDGLLGGEEIDVTSQNSLPPFGALGALGHHVHDGPCNHVDHAHDAGLNDMHHYHHHHHHHDHARPPAASSNKYDPRSSVGDESGFGSGPGYGNGPNSGMNGYVPSAPVDGGSDAVGTLPAATSGRGSATGGSSRRRAAKDDQVLANRQRERESKRREMEATEARLRLEEAISQQSIRKLSEAIDHVSKLVLQLGATVASDPATGAGNAGSSQPQTALDDPYGAFANEGTIDLTATSGGAVGGGNGAGLLPVGNTSHGVSASHNAALQVEAGLGLEVQKARKILAGLQAEERRVKEEKAREAAEAKRDASQQLVQKAMDLVLEGNDVRPLTRTVNRAKRAILEDDDPYVVEAGQLVELVAAAGSAHNDLKHALGNGLIEPLQVAIEDVRRTASALADKNGTAAAFRANGGDDPKKVVADAEQALAKLVEERDSEKAKKAAAEAQESKAIKDLQEALDSGKLSDVEACLEKAVAGLLSKESAAAAVIESAKKSFAKSLKSERRKLRQANATNEGSKIDAAVSAAKELNLSALEMDIAASVELGAKLRAQETQRADLKAAIAANDAESIAQIRVELQALGMFSEAEMARAELDNLQKASRARMLLVAARRDAQEATKELLTKVDSANAGDEFTMAEGQKLCDLVKRTKGKFGGSLDSLCEDTNRAASELAAAGRSAVHRAMKFEDTRALAGAIATYEKSFVSVDSPSMFDSSASQQCLADARARLAVLQAKEQEKVKAEAAQVKTEYALATSRRTTIRQRGGRRGRTQAPTSVPVAAPSLRSESVESTNSSDDDETLDADIAMGSRSVDVHGRPVLVNGRMNGGPGVSGAMLSGDGDCSHYYLWKEGTTVQCARCSNFRESVNGEWLQRVKKRGSNVPPELLASNSPSASSSIAGNGVPSATAVTQSARGVSASPSSMSQILPTGTSSGLKGRGPSNAPMGPALGQGQGGDLVGAFPPVVAGRMGSQQTTVGVLSSQQVSIFEQQQQRQQMQHRQQMQERKQHEQAGRLMRSQQQQQHAQAHLVGLSSAGGRYPASGGYMVGDQALPLVQNRHRTAQLVDVAPGARGSAAQGARLRSNEAPSVASAPVSRRMNGPLSDHSVAPAVGANVPTNGRRRGVGSGSGAAGRGQYAPGLGRLDVAQGSQPVGGVMHHGPHMAHAAQHGHLSHAPSAVHQHMPHQQTQPPRERSQMVPLGAAPAPQAADDSGMDLGMDFANENFGFDIDSLLGKGA